jgi:acyl-CoA synthetase (AMP-forming)/AMP-acid ligase II
VTGDQAQMDATGRVYIVGRYKDLIISGGENISPLKVERVLESCEGVNKVSKLVL